MSYTTWSHFPVGQILVPKQVLRVIDQFQPVSYTHLTLPTIA